MLPGIGELRINMLVVVDSATTQYATESGPSPYLSLDSLWDVTRQPVLIRLGHERTALFLESVFLDLAELGIVIEP